MVYCFALQKTWNAPIVQGSKLSTIVNKLNDIKITYVVSNIYN